MPKVPAAQEEYDAAGVHVNASDLSELRDDLLNGSGERYFDAMFGDLIISWPLLFACPFVAAVLAAGWTILATYTPRGLYVLAALATVGSFSGLTYVFWSEGDERMATRLSCTTAYV